MTEIPGKGNEHFRSPYTNPALRLFRDNRTVAKYPDTKALIKPVLTAIDQQGIAKFQQFEPKNFPGVKIPTTTIDINKVYGKVFGEHEIGEPDPNNKELAYFIFTGVQMPKTGSILTAWDMVLDRAVSLFPRIARARKEERKPTPAKIHVIASPHVIGGQVTKEWADALKQKGLALNGETYAEYVRSVLPAETEQLDKMRIVFHGMSKGAADARQTAMRLPPDIRARVQILKDNQKGDHEIKKWYKRIQIPVMFLLEGLYHMQFNKQLKQTIQEEPTILTRLRDILKQRGIEPDGDKDQQKLKDKVTRIEQIHMIKGMKNEGRYLEDGEEVKLRIHERKGMWDPLGFNIFDNFRTFLTARRKRKVVIEKEDGSIVTKITRPNPVKDQEHITKEGIARTTIWPIAGTHWISRYNVDKWAKKLNYAKTTEEKIHARA